MKIEGNQKELDAMVEFHKGHRVEGLRLQEEFAAEFRKEYKDKPQMRPHPHRLAAERTRHLPGLPHEQSELGLSRLRRQCAGRTDKNVAGYEL